MPRDILTTPLSQRSPCPYSVSLGVYFRADRSRVSGRNPNPKSSKSELLVNQTIKTAVFWVVIIASAFLLWQVTRGGQDRGSIPEISYSEFLSQVEVGEVARVTISGSTVNGTYRGGAAFRVIVPANQDAMIQTFREKKIEIWFRDNANSGSPAQLLGTWAPLVLLAGLWFFMIRQMQSRNTKNRADSQQSQS
jgi:ATP-dependent Zn protease